MTLYSIRQDSLKQVGERKIDLERDVQTLTEQNLETVFGLQFISTEFERNRLRIDTLAFDRENKAFVIIEYKRDRSFSIVDQGYAYLALLLNNKAEFILEYNERTGTSLRRDDVDWSQSRVIFVANSFTIHQRQAINFRDLPLEIWEVQRYDNDLINYSQIKPLDTSASIKAISKNSTIQEVSKEVSVHSIDEHFTGSRNAIRPLYEQFRDQLLSAFPNLQENPRGKYIGFSFGSNGSDTLVYVHPKSSWIWLDIPRVMPNDISNDLGKLHYKEGSLESKNTPVSQLKIETEEDLDYAIPILREVYKKTHAK